MFGREQIYNFDINYRSNSFDQQYPSPGTNRVSPPVFISHYVYTNWEYSVLSSKWHILVRQYTRHRDRVGESGSCDAHHGVTCHAGETWQPVTPLSVALCTRTHLAVGLLETVFLVSEYGTREMQARFLSSDGPACSDTDDATPRFACPLCERTMPTRDAIYRHLQVNHRKSRLCTALLDRTDHQVEPTAETDADTDPSRL